MSVRCSAISKSTGRRCQNYTKRGQKCWIHLRSLDKLRVKKSRIPDAGLGLYTLKTIKKNKTVAPYGGRIVRRKPKNSAYIVEMSRNKWMDGSQPTSSVARFANQCLPENKRARKCKGNNAKLSISNRHNTVKLKARKKIKSGEEVFLNYGDAYWN